MKKAKKMKGMSSVRRELKNTTNKHEGSKVTRVPALGHY